MIRKHSETWKTIEDFLETTRDKLVKRLIRADDEKVRGKIQMIDEILNEADNQSPQGD